jgi:hypothetical protein
MRFFLPLLLLGRCLGLSEQSGYQLYKICSSYHEGQSLQRSLKTLLPFESYHPLSVTKEKNEICFVTILNGTSSREVIGTLPLTLFQEISHEERVHQSMRHFLSLLPASSLHKSSLSKRKQSDVFQAKILLSFGVGAMNKVGAEIDQTQLQVEKIRQRFLNRNPIHDLTAARPSFSRSTSQSILSSSDLWDSAISSLHRSSSSPLSSDPCSLSQIFIERLPSYQIELRNFEEYFTSCPEEIHRACLLSLISHLLLTYSLLVDIRIIFPKYPSNHWNKGIVQNNSYSEFYPYHEAGLDGSGQIIGIGESTSLSLPPSLSTLHLR